MEAVKSVLVGKNPKVTFVLATAIIGAKVWYNSKYPMTGEETEEEKKESMMKLAVVIGVVPLLVLPVIYQQMSQKSTPSSSFESRVASAANEMRNMEGLKDNGGLSDFHNRVTEAANKLRGEIQKKIDLPSSSAAVSSSSSLVAEAASEIEKFISENS